jgi:SAM-dependent methyltransferase
LIEQLDPKRVREYLLSFDAYAGAPLAARNYVHGALRRFLTTLGLTLPGGEGQRLLELGASPYYLTLLLKKYRRYELVLANFFGDSFPTESEQIVRSAALGEEHVFHFRNFNGERDVFPYPDDSFDVVLFCEIIEHLTVDPTHFLCEIHRVLKPGGHLLITTPNARNLDYVIRLLRNTGNVFHPYSGYGVYGRHQREYTLNELSDLLQGIGYTVVEARIDDIYQYGRVQTVLRRLQSHWRDNLYILARRTGERRYYYPPNLFISTHAIHRVVSCDVRMGWNEIGHLGFGWWGPEQIDGCGFRWATGKARVHLLRPDGARHARLEVNSGAAELGPVTLSVTGPLGEQVEQVLERNQWQTVDLPLNESTSREVELVLEVNPTRNPARSHLSIDDRDLGVMVRRIQIADE